MPTLTPPSASLVIRPPSYAAESAWARYIVELQGSETLYRGIRPDDWMLVANSNGVLDCAGRVLRLRLGSKTTTAYFDRVYIFPAGLTLADVHLTPPSAGEVGRLGWDVFLQALKQGGCGDIKSVESIRDAEYVRELLQIAVSDDLLGPAGGPNEIIKGMSVRDRYLVGKLAPRDTAQRGLEIAVDVESANDGLEKADPKTSNPELSSPQQIGDESESNEETDSVSNQSLVPSSVGLTFCVAGDVGEVSVEARWGSYRRLGADEMEDEVDPESGKRRPKPKMWEREHCGGTVVLPILEGPVGNLVPDQNHPGVVVQGVIRPPQAGKTERVITLFLLNAQHEPEVNRDSAWIFQPELVVCATEKSAQKAVFHRRPLSEALGNDAELDALEMVYRNRVEFAVGHGISVHAIASADDPQLAVAVRTQVIPSYEVQVTETPGNRPGDRAAQRGLVQDGLLDMKTLASLERDELVAALERLATDYALWIDEQRARIGNDIVGHEGAANDALDRCLAVQKRLLEGVETLRTNDDALAAFRFANHAMAIQRVRSSYSLAVRRKEECTLEQHDIPSKRTWRPFQLAFLLLSIPSLTDPNHDDRTQPGEAHADLLWFPTGGGKTEAYLGVAAFAMAIRRLQSKVGGYDGSRGLSVIMRYTLRLLTLQQFQRATALLCAMEDIRRTAFTEGDKRLGAEPFTIGLWVGNKNTPGTTEDSASAIEAIRNPDRNRAGLASPAQLTTCPWCGSEVAPGRDIEVDVLRRRTILYCGDKMSRCPFSKGQSSAQAHPGLPVTVVDEELYLRPPSMLIATVDKFAMMAWRGRVRTLFGRADRECPRHGLLGPDADCTGNHPAHKGLPATKARDIDPLRPPDLIIQDEFHLISGPLGTMVGLYESAVDELCTWKLENCAIRPKIIASTATVRKAREQVQNVFMRQVAVFPPSGLDVEDNYFSRQRPVADQSGRRYLGICAPGSSRPSVLIRVYTAFLTAAQELFDRFGDVADPYMTMVGYFNSLRELGGMKRLAEDDVQFRAFRVQMSDVDRPGLAQRNIKNIRELTSRVSNHDIPEYLDQLEVKFKAEYNQSLERYVTRWTADEARAIDLVLATNMLSVGVDVNRLGVMAVNGQPKGTAEYIQATSRVGRAHPGLVCTVLTWARPRDLSHYETFEHYHATFYKHVEAQSVTPFSPRALDRGLTGSMLSLMRLEHESFGPNKGAGSLQSPGQAEMASTVDILVRRAWNVSESADIKNHTEKALKSRADHWAKEVQKGGRILAYERRGSEKDKMVNLIKPPGVNSWDDWTVPQSMREVEPGVRLVMYPGGLEESVDWQPRSITQEVEE